MSTTATPSSSSSQQQQQLPQSQATSPVPPSYTTAFSQVNRTAPNSPMPPSQQHQQQHHRSLSDNEYPIVNTAEAPLKNRSNAAINNPFDQLFVATATTTVCNDDNNNQQQQQAAPALPNLSSTTGVILGVEQLERQQMEREKQLMAVTIKKNTPTMPVGPVLRASSEPPHNATRKNPFDDAAVVFDGSVQKDVVMEEQLQLQSNANNAGGGTRLSENVASRGTFRKMIAPLRTRVSETKIADSGNSTNIAATSTKSASVTVTSSGCMEMDRRDDSDDDWPKQQQQELKSLISGYLYKKTRNGTWQRRFFETDGQCLTYYKSKRRTKKLAELDLYKVGSIEIDVSEPVGASFIIQVKNRPYYLRAENKECAEDWVINLNRVREARFGIGGMKLTTKGKMQDPAVAVGQREGSANRHHNPSMPVGFVVSSNRQRSHALRQDDGGSGPGDWPDSIEYDVHGNSIRYEDKNSAHAAAGPQFDDGGDTDEHYAKWKKGGTRLRMIRYRFVRWARNINMGICQGDDRENVIEPANSRATETSVGGDTSVVGSEVSGLSHGHAQGQGQVGETATTWEKERNERGMRSFRVDVKAMIKGAARSPKRTNIEPGPTSVADRNDAPTPTFHMA